MSVAHFCVFYAQDANNQRRARLRVILEERKHKEQSASNLVAALFSKTPKRAQVCVCVRVCVCACDCDCVCPCCKQDGQFGGGADQQSP